MRFVFDELKAAQAAGYLLAKHSSSMPYIKLIKLLYLADRQSLIETGYPITGASMVSMPYGPVLSKVYDRITWESERPTVWAEYVADLAAKEVSGTNVTATDHLSEYEQDVLGAVYRQWGQWNKWDLVRYTRELPEWSDDDGLLHGGRAALPPHPHRRLADRTDYRRGGVYRHALRPPADDGGSSLTPSVGMVIVCATRCGDSRRRSRARLPGGPSKARA